MTTVDPPDRSKPSDAFLDWLASYRREWEERYAALDVECANTEWIAIYVATQAMTLENAPIADRRAVIREIRSVMVEAALWPPEELKGE